MFTHNGKIENVQDLGIRSHSFTLKEWHLLIGGAIFCFMLASIMMSGWPNGLLPNLSSPYVYSGDGLSHAWITQRIIEGWVYDNPRSGYPFGSNFLDYPGSDSGNLLVIKLLSFFTGSYPAVFNLFFLLSFSAVFGFSYFSLRSIGLNRWFSISAAIIYSFIPFHFQRITHTFYLWYFVVPIFFYMAFQIFFKAKEQVYAYSKIDLIILGCALIVCASFGVYYALFGIITLGTAGLVGWLASKRYKPLALSALASTIVILGIGINTAPNIVHKFTSEPNPAVANRSPAEAEEYGLKLIQLVLPRSDHRSQVLAEITRNYESSHPLVNENRTVTLGFVGTFGLLILGVVALIKLADQPADPRLSLLSIIAMVLFLFGTVGGLGAVFSEFISPLIRGWNRISVFIAFACIAATFIVIQNWFISCAHKKFCNVFMGLVSSVLLVLALWDQSVSVCETCNSKIEANYKADRDFVKSIESSLPIGSAIYQLPYMPFPEAAPRHNLHTYELAAGFLHSESLRWNYAGMKGRDGDNFYRALSQEPIDVQVDVVRRLGFDGIYIDRRGYEDNADSLIGELTKVLHTSPLIVHADGQSVFFKLEHSLDVTFEGMSPYQIMKNVGYIADKLGHRYPAEPKDGIDFTRQNWPVFVKSVSGLSGWESWGRWSDQNLDPTVKIELSDPLPDKFVIKLNVQPFGPNVNKPLTIKVGGAKHEIKLYSGSNEVALPIDLEGEVASVIELIPYHPISPKELGYNGDRRKLGVGLIKMTFEE